MGRCDRVTSQSRDANTKKWEWEWTVRMDGPKMGLKTSRDGNGNRNTQMGRDRVGKGKHQGEMADGASQQGV